MCVRNPRKLWGFEKAEQLVSLIACESKKQAPDSDAVNIGKGVLASYMMYKASQEDAGEKEKLKALKEKVAKSGINFPTGITEYGGTLHLTKEDMLVKGCDQLYRGTTQQYYYRYIHGNYSLNNTCNAKFLGFC